MNNYVITTIAYLCNRKHNTLVSRIPAAMVVNCFNSCIFATANTTKLQQTNENQLVAKTIRTKKILP